MEVSALTHAGSMPGLRGPTALLRLQSDERLIALTRRGQPAAFETLCARYSSRLQAFCRHMLGSREDAEDVLQEVFAAAFNAVLADEREINVRPWLYRIARNRSLNHLRRAAAIGVDTMDTHFAENGISTSDKVLRRESFRELIADVHELPETQRTALLLREIDALSYDQIAQAMETTIPSVKSLLVRARISLAEAAEARKLSCGEVRLELGGVAEGLAKLSTPARRHVRSCERCAFFKKQLKVNNRALAAVMPVGPLLLAKKLLIAKLGSTASAGSAHVAGSAGATMGAGATIGAGAAAGGGAGLAGGLMTAGAGALATKAVAGLAAAAIVTAGTVAAEHSGAHHPHASRAATYASVPAARYAAAPVVVGEQAQPVTAGRVALRRDAATAARARARRLAAAKALSSTPALTVAATLPALTPATSAQPGLPVATPVEPPSAVQVTEVTTEATQLPTSATTPPVAAPPTATTPASETPTATAPPAEAPTATGPPTPAPTTTTTTTTTTPTPTTPSSPSATPLPLPSAEPVSVPNPAAGAPVPRRSLRRALATGGTEAPAHHSPDGGWGRRWAIRR
jgi:RNA polymerase sigma factor (sigma-70 family)